MSSHVLHALHTVSAEPTHEDEANCDAPQTVHEAHPVSCSPLQDVVTYSNPAVHVVQGVHVWLSSGYAPVSLCTQGLLANVPSKHAVHWKNCIWIVSVTESGTSGGFVTKGKPSPVSHTVSVTVMVP